jgi:hypothetical protein
MDVSNSEIRKRNTEGLLLKARKSDKIIEAFFHSPGGSFRLYGQMCCIKNCTKFTYIGQLCRKHGISVAKLEVKNSTIENAGVGLFACKSPTPAIKKDIVFKKGDVISYYFGLKLNSDDRIMLYGRNHKNKNNIDNVYSSYFSNKTIVIDGALKRCFVACGNSPISAKYCNSKLVLSPNGPTLSLIAKNDIKHGDEIFYNYGKTYSKTAILHYTNNSIDNSSTDMIMEF